MYIRTGREISFKISTLQKPFNVSNKNSPYKKKNLNKLIILISRYN